MQLYHWLSRIPFLQRYSRKFLFVAFAGLQVPLLGVAGFTFLFPHAGLTPGGWLGLLGGFTLLATAATLTLLNALTQPVRRTKDALETYLYTQAVPDLPAHYRDEAGLLMQDVQHAVLSLEKLLAEKKDTFHLLSRELREPAQAVLSLLEQMRHEQNPRELERHFTRVQQLLTGQLDLMSGLLQVLQRDESGHLQVNTTPVPFGDVLQDALYDLEGSLMRKGIAMDLQFAADLVVAVEPKSFGQVLHHVVGNAIKSSETGGLITVTAKTGANGLVITVADEGAGFQPSLAETLFERFRRRPGAETVPGDGADFHLCRKTMLRHGGDITAQSPGQGGGAVFTLTLPAGAAVAAPAKTAPAVVKMA
jgi:signal transduction histidine kinase